jgi:hypothetical protein
VPAGFSRGAAAWTGPDRAAGRVAWAGALPPQAAEAALLAPHEGAVPRSAQPAAEGVTVVSRPEAASDAKAEPAGVAALDVRVGPQPAEVAARDVAVQAPPVEAAAQRVAGVAPHAVEGAVVVLRAAEEAGVAPHAAAEAAQDEVVPQQEAAALDAAGARPAGRPSVLPVVGPSAAAWAFHPARLHPAPAPRPAAQSAHAMQRLPIASRSERS